MWLTRFAKEAREATIETIEVGAGIWVKEISERKLLSKIRNLLDPSSPTEQNLRRAQGKAYPIPRNSGASLAALASTIIELLGL